MKPTITICLAILLAACNTQKKQETELHVQVAEKPENQKENVGEALACFCIYVGWYLMVMQFCRASLAMTLSGSVGAILLVMAVLVNGQKENSYRKSCMKFWQRQFFVF